MKVIIKAIKGHGVVLHDLENNTKLTNFEVTTAYWMSCSNSADFELEQVLTLDVREIALLFKIS